MAYFGGALDWDEEVVFDVGGVTIDSDPRFL